MIETVPGYPKYKVTEYGEVYSTITNKYLKQQKNRGGYWSVRLYTSGDGSWVFKFVYHLVLETYDRPKPEGLECRHLDGKPGNNHISNLKWGTPHENSLDTVRMGNHAGRNKKLEEHEVIIIHDKVRSKEWSPKQAAVLYDVSREAIMAIKHHRNWGYLFE